MHTPRWAEDLIIDACIHLGIEDVPQVVWRKRKGRETSGLAYYGDNGNRITINAGTSRLDAKLVLLHELAHIARPGRDIKKPYKEWYEAMKTACAGKHIVIAPFNPKLQNRVITTMHISHTPEFWDTAWELFRWAKLPIAYCKEREFEYKKGAIAGYHRSKAKQRQNGGQL